MFRILYVDDDPILLTLAKNFMEKTGEYEVTTMTSAAEALKSPEILSYDVIVSDYEMPGINGIAFLRAVKDTSQNLPFIIFTGRGREEIVIKAIDNGADFYVQKGGDPGPLFAELMHKIKTAIERRRAINALRKSEVRFRSIIQSLDEYITILNEKWELVYSSPTSLKMFGYSPEYLVGKNAFDFMHPDDVELVRMEAEESLKKDHVSVPLPYRLRKADGSYLYVESKMANLLDVPEVNGLVVTTRDISEHKNIDNDISLKDAQLVAISSK